MPHRRQHTIAQIRLYRSIGMAKHRRRRPKMLQPDGVRLWYYQQIRAVLRRAWAVVERSILPYLPEWVATSTARGDTRMDSTVRAKDAIDKAIDAFNRRQADDLADLERTVKQAAQRTADFNRQELGKQIRAAIGVDLPLNDPRFADRVADFTARNVALIKDITDDHLRRVSSLVIGGVSDGRRWEDIARDVKDRLGVDERRARLIARDQCGKFYGAVNTARQQALGVTEYVWRTSNDSRVRDEHADREGETFAYADPPEDGNPGQAVNCRCNAEPVLDNIFDEASERAAA
jgi:SPP1 gp7 family putative phage head morphogenesis protein